jgi:hypothetical protein
MNKRNIKENRVTRGQSRSCLGGVGTSWMGEDAGRVCRKMNNNKYINKYIWQIIYYLQIINICTYVCKWKK